MSSFMKMPRILVTLIIAALVVPAISSTMLVQNAYASPDQAPVLDPIGDKTVDEGQLLQFTVSATDPDGDNLTYSASNLPTGASFNGSTSTFSWTPAYDQAGAYPEACFEVTDGNLTASENITITVGDINRPPVLGPIGNKTVDENETLTFNVLATDPDSDNLTYSASNLPTGATFNVSIDFPTFSWIPGYDQAGDHEVQFAVSDGYLSDSENITITVTNVNGPPVLVPIGNKTVNENETLTFNVLATDPDSDNLTYSASNLPTGATFNVSIDFPTFSWIPTYDQAGDYEVRFEVTDGYLSDSENITITVGNVNRPPVIESVTADPDRLWPPNHKHVDVSIMIDVIDPDGPGDNITRTTYFVTDEYGIYDVAVTDLPDNGVISLTAERHGWDRDGRFYTITVIAYDTGGLSNNGTVRVVVPHDQGKRGKPVTAYDAGDVSDSGSVDVAVPYGQSKKRKTATTYDAGDVPQGGSADVAVPHDKGKKGKKGKSGK